MIGELSKNKIEYILLHLEHHIKIDQYRNKFLFISNDKDINKYSDSIIFKLSDSDFNIKYVNWIDNIPVLFPNSSKNIFFYQSGSNIIIEHDILKSCFYLLSGYQEYVSDQKDNLGRFPYIVSAQNKLGFIDKPIVNYYFEILTDAIKTFAKTQESECVILRNKITDSFVFLLSHDIDRIVKYDIFYIIRKIRQFLGINKTHVTKFNLFKQICLGAIGLINPIKKWDSYWNFNYLIKEEISRGFRSTYFFLPKNKKHVDAHYQFRLKRLKKLYKLLTKYNCELGLHGTVEASISDNQLKKDITQFKKDISNHIYGVRQHRLSFSLPETLLIQEKNGIKYDSSLGFANHEGFRNSYCHPFKLYDFENDRIINVWEFPLIVMDGTLLSYRKLNNKDAIISVRKLLKEIMKFNGVFSLLWHNSYFDEVETPNVTKLYISILDLVKEFQPDNMTNVELYNKLENDATI